MLQITMIIALAHLIYCPFTKVEESFNIQAMHDILYHKFDLSQYDHLEFPGVVPRTFIGPLFISILASPVVWLLQLLDVNKFYAQYIVRAILSVCVVGSLKILSKTLEKQFGSRWLQWFIAVTITQSHFMFYLSRPLPNIMALPLALLALDGWLNNNHKKFILFSGAAIIIFRFELALFLGLLLMHDLYYKRVTLTGLLQIAVPGGICLLLLTTVIDSIFWTRPLWPEGEVLWYNTVLNKSSDWGTSPFLWYFYSAIPRGLAASTFLVPIGFYLDQRVRKLVISVFVFVFIYSFLPHKELRFIIYVFPFLNVAAATACHRIWENRNKTPIYHFLSLGVAGHLAVNVIFTLFLLSISGKNYPGGTAISHFHRLMRNESFVHVHIANLAAQSGVSRFTQINPSWIYNKTEHLDQHHLLDYTHLIAEGKSKFDSKLKPFSATHDVVYTVEAFHQVSFNYLTIPPVIIKTKPVLFILRKRDNYKKFLEIQGNEYYKEEDEETIENLNISQEDLERIIKANPISEENRNKIRDFDIVNKEITTKNSEQNSEHVQKNSGKNLPTKLEKLPKNKLSTDKLRHRPINIGKYEKPERQESKNEIPHDLSKEIQTENTNIEYKDSNVLTKLPKIKKFTEKIGNKPIIAIEKEKRQNNLNTKIEEQSSFSKEILSVKKSIKNIVQSEKVEQEKYQKIREVHVPSKTIPSIRQSVKDSIKKIKSKLSSNEQLNSKTDNQVAQKAKTKVKLETNLEEIKIFKIYESSEESKKKTKNEFKIMQDEMIFDEGKEDIISEQKKSFIQGSKSDSNKSPKVYSSEKISEQKETINNKKENVVDQTQNKSNVEREIEIKIEELRILLDRLEKELTGKETKDAKDIQNNTEKQIEAKIEELTSKEVKLNNEKDEKRVKQNIKKIVQKYKRKKFEKVEDETDSGKVYNQDEFDDFKSNNVNAREYLDSETEINNGESKEYLLKQKSKSVNGKEIYSTETFEHMGTPSEKADDSQLHEEIYELFLEYEISSESQDKTSHESIRNFKNANSTLLTETSEEKEVQSKE